MSYPSCITLIRIGQLKAEPQNKEEAIRMLARARIPGRQSKMLRQPSLFEHRIRGMPRLDLLIHREMDTGVRREPDVVVSFSRLYKMKTSVEQETLQIWSKTFPPLMDSPVSD